MCEPFTCLLTLKVLPFVFFNLTQVCLIVVSNTEVGNESDSPSCSAFRLPAMLIPVLRTNFVIYTDFLLYLHRKLIVFAKIH